ncbi:hypothetical protein [Leekyejoonella antrihumi]|nr:hypothetical protein [Leekyejoonella antrihumi]
MRAIEIARAAWGGTMLLTPATTLSTIHGLKIDTTSTTVARVLGARQVVQAGLSGIAPSPEILALGVWVDLAHAASAFGLAVADRSRVRAGIADGAVALAWAGFGYRDLVRSKATPPSHDRRRDELARAVLGLAPGGGPLLRISQRHRQV